MRNTYNLLLACLIGLVVASCSQEAPTPPVEGEQPVEGEGELPFENQMSPLGTVTVLGTNCNGTSSFPNTTCVELEIDCAPTALPKKVDLRITPTTAAISLGTVIYGSGAAGHAFYEDKGAGTITAALAAGFDAIQRSWDGQQGWLEGSGGLKASACRYATLATWIYNNQHTAGEPFCATGNSGGASEMAYALSQFGRESIFDLIVPTAGPPMSRVDIGCISNTQDPLKQQCLTQPLHPDHMCTTFGCDTPTQAIDPNYSGITPCASETLNILKRHSVLGGNRTDLDYPDTSVRFIFGENDCSSGAGLSYYYYNELVAQGTNDVSLTIAANTAHRVHGTPNGAAAIVNALSTDCIFRH